MPPEHHRERRISSEEHRAAYEAARAAPAEHKPRLITSRSVAPLVHGSGRVGRVNNWLAVHITKAWLSQSFLQLVLLPIIIVGQNVISASQDARAEADHLTLTTLHAINVQQLKLLEQQRETLQRQREILDLLREAEVPPPAPNPDL